MKIDNSAMLSFKTSLRQHYPLKPRLKLVMKSTLIFQIQKNNEKEENTVKKLEAFVEIFDK